VAGSLLCGRNEDSNNDYSYYSQTALHIRDIRHRARTVLTKMVFLLCNKIQSIYKKSIPTRFKEFIVGDFLTPKCLGLQCKRNRGVPAP